MDSGSLEERVRFDDNVSVIDDHGGVTMSLSSATGVITGDGQILEDVEAEEQEERKYSDTFTVVIKDPLSDQTLEVNSNEPGHGSAGSGSPQTKSVKLFVPFRGESKD